MLSLASFVLLASLGIGYSPVQAQHGIALPTVDLEYAIHRPTYDSDEDLYTFKNIRFADPPLGAKRFRRPVAVSTVDRETINDGSYGYKCRQSHPAWVLASVAAQQGRSLEEVWSELVFDPEANEDCLFLNVVVPKSLFPKKMKKEEHGQKPCGGKKGAPVVVWIYGGGWTLGHKDSDSFNPSGLIERSKTGHSDGVIFVAMNYRLGMFGWSYSGEGDERVDANAGLYDQRLALKWVRQNIAKFGGDPDNVTVMGESAGGASVLLHITAQGGKAPNLFNKGIVQSPGFQRDDGKTAWESTLATAQNITGLAIETGSQLAALDEQTLLLINAQVVFAAELGTYTFGPLLDGDYLPDWPDTLLEEGRFDKTPTLMIGHQANETIGWASDPSTFQGEGIMGLLIAILVGDIGEKALQRVFTKLYPPASEATGKKGLYYTEYGRALLLSAELAFTCLTRQLANAFGNETYSYRFDVPPAAHGQDVGYTFYDGRDSSVDTGVAEAMQTYFGRMARKGNPNDGKKADLPVWPVYGEDSKVISFGDGGAKVSVDDSGADRCAFWREVQQG